MDDKSEVRRELFLRSKPRRNRSPSTVPGVSEAAPLSPVVPSSVAAARLEAPPPSMEVAELLAAELLRPSHGRKLSRRVFFPDRNEVDEGMRAGPPPPAAAAAAALAVGTSIECRCDREICESSWACPSERRGEREATLLL